MDLFDVMSPTQIAAKICRELKLIEEASQLTSLDNSSNIRESIRMTKQAIQDLTVRATAIERREMDVQEI